MKKINLMSPRQKEGKISYRSLPIDVEIQCYPNWCWAACGTMMNNLKTHLKKTTQENFSKRYLGKVTSCNCKDQTNWKACNKTLPKEKVKDVFNPVLSLPKLRGESHISSMSVDHQLNQKSNPILVGLTTNESKTYGHLILIIGSQLINGQYLLHVIDPKVDRPFYINHSSLVNGDYHVDSQPGNWMYSWI